MQGHRRPGIIAPHELEPGDYVRRLVTVDDRTYPAWWVCTPNGLLGRLSMPEDTPNCHHVEEHEDGTISVLPQPGNSNSILVTGWPLDGGTRAEGEPRKSWHGYIRRGVWEAC